MRNLLYRLFKITHYPQPFAAFVRVYRHLNNRCIVCGGNHAERPYRYCSYECSVYDGVASIRFKPDNSLPKSQILTGKTTEIYLPKKHWG